jgi:hypothetical protein
VSASNNNDNVEFGIRMLTGKVSDAIAEKLCTKPFLGPKPVIQISPRVADSREAL